MKTLTATFTLLLTIILNLGVTTNAEETNELRMKTERVVIFKDGYCLVIKRAMGKTNDKGELYTDKVPTAAVLGSFWAVPQKGRLLSMIAETVTDVETTTNEQLCVRRLELLQANKGSTCTVEILGRTYEGTIVEILANDSKVTTPASPSYSSHLTQPSFLSSTVNTSNGTLFVLRTEDGDQMFDISQIRRLNVVDMKVKRTQTTTTTKKGKRLTLRFDKPNTKQELVIIYFTPGMRWIPTYRVELMPENTKKKMAKMTLQAEILNETEDLDDVQIDLVVGVPNFRFRTVVSPLSLEGTLRNALRQVAPQIMGQFSNALFSQRSSEHRAAPRHSNGGSRGTMALPKELTVGGQQDLFVYHLDKMTLKKGARAAAPIFTASVPYRDVYTWNVNVKRKGERATANSGLTSPLKLATNQIWHQIVLENTTKVPWTTGAVMVMEGYLPLCQELLTYTSAGAAVRVPITIATDLRGAYDEKEVLRTPKAMNYLGYNYMRVDKTSTTTLTSHKNIPIDLEITCNLGGRVTEASAKGVITLDDYLHSDWINYYGHGEVNNHSTIVWTHRLEAGKTFNSTFKYHYFLRH